MKSKQHISIYNIAFAGVMAAIIYVLTMFRFPLFGSKVHFANAMCLLAGLLFGPLGGGLAAGIGSALYDLLVGGYGVVEALITLVMKFLMAFICAKAAGADGQTVKHGRIVAGCVTGALSYVALYMLKTFVFQRFVYGYPADAVWVTMLSKLPASLINAVFAMIVAPVLYEAVRPALAKTGMLAKLQF